MEIDFLHSGDGIFLPIEVKSPEQVTYGGHPEVSLTGYRKQAPLRIVIYPVRELVQIRKNIWAIPD